jgi:Uma2 family endonuclease
MAVEQRISEEAYQDFVLRQPEGQWELHDGRLVEKPGMTWKHGRLAVILGALLLRQLDSHVYHVVSELRVRRPVGTVFIPDLMVVPAEYDPEMEERPILAIFSAPLPLVIEIWSPSTGDYDLAAKIPVYQQRGDREIWRIHPYEKTLTAWVRQADGSYRESVHRAEAVTPAALPDVTIDLNELFDN